MKGGERKRGEDTDAEGDRVCVWRGDRKREKKRLKDGLRAHLLSVCILMRHCGNPASQAAVKVTRDYQDHD